MIRLVIGADCIYILGMFMSIQALIELICTLIEQISSLYGLLLICRCCKELMLKWSIQVRIGAIWRKFDGLIRKGSGRNLLQVVINLRAYLLAKNSRMQPTVGGRQPMPAPSKPEILELNLPQVVINLWRRANFLFCEF